MPTTSETANACKACMTEKQFRSNSEHRPHSGYLSGTRTVSLYGIGVVTPSALLAPLDADGAACAARGKERIDLTHRPELRDGILLADAHVVRLLRVCVHGAVDRNACGNAAAVERLCLDRAAVVDGRSAQVDQNGRGGVLRRDADAQRWPTRADRLKSGP